MTRRLRVLESAGRSVLSCGRLYDASFVWRLPISETRAFFDFETLIRSDRTKPKKRQVLITVPVAHGASFRSEKCFWLGLGEQRTLGNERGFRWCAANTESIANRLWNYFETKSRFIFKLKSPTNEELLINGSLIAPLRHN